MTSDLVFLCPYAVLLCPYAVLLCPYAVPRGLAVDSILPSRLHPRGYFNDGLLTCLVSLKVWITRVANASAGTADTGTVDTTTILADQIAYIHRECYIYTLSQWTPTAA